MTAAPDPLRARCECGEYGKGLSLCKACGAFISMTLTAAPDPDDEAVPRTLGLPPEASMRCRRGSLPPCKWPRCDCPVDLVYATDIHIQRPNRK